MKIQSGHDSVHRRTDGQTDKVIPVYPPINFVEAGGIKIKCSKPAGPSGIVVEMMKAAGKEGVDLARQLTEAVLSCGVIPSDCEENFTLNFYKGKGEALTMETIMVSSSQIKS